MSCDLDEFLLSISIEYVKSFGEYQGVGRQGPDLQKFSLVM